MKQWYALYVFLYSYGVTSAPSQYNERLFQKWDSNAKDKTVARPSYLYHGDIYAGKTSLYWDDPLAASTGSPKPTL